MSTSSSQEPNLRYTFVRAPQRGCEAERLMVNTACLVKHKTSRLDGLTKTDECYKSKTTVKRVHEVSPVVGEATV